MNDIGFSPYMRRETAVHLLSRKKRNSLLHSENGRDPGFLLYPNVLECKSVSSTTRLTQGSLSFKNLRSFLDLSYLPF